MFSYGIPARILIDIALGKCSADIEIKDGVLMDVYKGKRYSKPIIPADKDLLSYFLLKTLDEILMKFDYEVVTLFQRISHD